MRYRLVRWLLPWPHCAGDGRARFLLDGIQFGSSGRREESGAFWIVVGVFLICRN